MKRVACNLALVAVNDLAKRWVRDFNSNRTFPNIVMYRFNSAICISLLYFACVWTQACPVCMF